MEEIVEDVVTGSEEYVANRFASKSKDDSWCIYKYDSVEQAERFNRNTRGCLARAFWRGCTFNSVLKTCILSAGDTYTWLDNSFGLTWVAVDGMGNSMSVVTRHRDLDMECVSRYHQTLPKYKVIHKLTEAITYDVEALACDDDFGLSIKNPFSVVSAFPVTNTGEPACSLEYDKEKAIKFLSEKMECESVITLDDAIKTSISAFKHMCVEELKAEDYWVSFWDRGLVHHMKVPDIEEHLAAIDEWSASRKRKREADGFDISLRLASV